MHRIINADCLTALRSLPDNSVDAVVTDPPYGLSNTDPGHVAEAVTAWVGGDREFLPSVSGGFMGKAWDSFVPPVAVWDECLRVLKPGGHLLAFAGSRTQDLMGLSIRLAGFDIRDSFAWLYGSGFPKSQDVPKFIDKHLGATGAYGAPKSEAHAGWVDRGAMRGTEGDAGWQRPWMQDGEAVSNAARKYEGGSSEAKQWEGWGTALKPAFEPVIMARKPFKGTVAANVLEHGTGALNIDASRIGNGGQLQWEKPRGIGYHGGTDNGAVAAGANTQGRFPANVLLDESQAAVLDGQSGTSRSSAKPRRRDGTGNELGQSGGWNKHENKATESAEYGDSGGASRFFYVAKAPKKERPVVDGVAHPTVKPLALMRYLVRMVTPSGGTVLEPFAGSGTTLEAALLEDFGCIAIEREAEYIPLIEARADRVMTTFMEDLL